MTLEDHIFKDVFLGPYPYSNYNSPLTPVSKMLASFDGIHSGVPTRTTATLTPTTLKNIEQTFIELTNDTSQSVPCQAGFVPPLPSFPFEPEPNELSLGSSDSNTSESWHTSPPPIANEDLNSSSGSTSKPSRRNMGGRRPNHSHNLSPEEEEKRKVRRERNKLAAARCRKRRVDQTNDLLEKVSQLEKDKQRLQNEIEGLQTIKGDLEYCLQSHRVQCRLTLSKAPLEFKHPTQQAMLLDKIKVEPVDSMLDDDLPEPAPKRILLSAANPTIGANQSLNTPTICKPSRPSSLNVPLTMTPSQALVMNKNVADIAGVQITTPSTGVMFNFDSLMDGGTGLTPVAVPCSDKKMLANPLDLATPTSEPSKLVSL